jgi:hypothetical protein
VPPGRGARLRRAARKGAAWRCGGGGEGEVPGASSSRRQVRELPSVGRPMPSQRVARRRRQRADRWLSSCHNRTPVDMLLRAHMSTVIWYDRGSRPAIYIWAFPHWNCTTNPPSLARLQRIR